jgi:uncharacterized membrane protein
MKRVFFSIACAAVVYLGAGAILLLFANLPGRGPDINFIEDPLSLYSIAVAVVAIAVGVWVFRGMEPGRLARRNQARLDRKR